MVKDFDYYRSDFIVETHDSLNNILKQAEKLTPIEGIVLFYLARLQMYFGTGLFIISSQYKIDDYIVDFFIEYKQKDGHKKIIVECDGHEFHEKTKEQAAKQKKRDRHFATKEFIMLHYSGSDIVNQPELIFKDFITIFKSK